MREGNNIDIVKSSGERVKFSIEKLRKSLLKTGANQKTIEDILAIIRSELYTGISTNEIYNRAFSLLRKKESHFASRYKLKKAIYELGPTGFPFEHLVSEIMSNSGYRTEVGITIQGKCLKHEIDVLAQKNKEVTLIECKFHGEQGLKCNVTVPLYINSRYNDIKASWGNKHKDNSILTKGWVVTNTRFTEDAIKYGKCCGLYLLSWDYPKHDGIKDRIDRLGLFPITVSTLMSSKEKHFLLERGIVLCKSLLKESFFLDHLGVSEQRKNRILNEMKSLCIM